MTQPLQRNRFRRISASAVRASKKYSIIANRKSTIGAFQRAIDEVRSLPLTPPKGGSKSEFAFKNKFHYVFVIVEASDFKFGKQLGFAKFHR